MLIISVFAILPLHDIYVQYVATITIIFQVIQLA